MAQWKLLGTTAFIALVSGNAVLADVTPEEVWEGWKALGTNYGQTITTTSEGRDGDDLVIEGMTMAMDQEGTTVNMTVPEMIFTDMGDGTVEVAMSDEYPMVVTMPATEEGGEPVEIEVMLSHPDMVITASGSAEETRYDFSAPTFAIALAEISGVDADKLDITATLTVSGMEGNYILTGTDAKALSSSFAATSVDMAFSGSDTEAGSTFSLTGKIADMAGTSTANLVGDMADMAAALKAGFSTDGGFTYGAATYDLAVTDATGDMKINGQAASGGLTFKMGADGLGYGGDAKGVTITASGAQIPFPELKVSYAESAFNLMMPVAAAAEPGEFALVTKLVDLVLPEDVWGMFDPTAQLPRDPLTVVLDTSGTAKLNVDIMDPASMETLGDGMPGELNSLNLNALQIKLAGAEVTGTGALTFDNTDLVTFGGVPTPTGVIELKAVGVNGLLDKLSAMGLIPEDQLAGGRMMMGMFAKMVDGEADTMTSTLEFKDKGFFANGMQLQ